MSNPYEKTETIYWLGYNAFCLNIHEAPKKVARNFYLIREWQRGYNQAYFDNQKGTRLSKFEVKKKLNSKGFSRPTVSTETIKTPYSVH